MRYESMHACHVFHFSHGHLSLTPFLSFIRKFSIKNLVIGCTITSFGSLDNMGSEMCFCFLQCSHTSTHYAY